jgi:hypothetical protein
MSDSQNIATLKSCQKCCLCHENYSIEMPNVCGTCIVKKSIEIYKQERDGFKKTFTREFKQFTYFVLFASVPLILLGWRYGLEVQLVMIAYQLWCDNAVQPLMRFFMKIF